MFGSKQELFFRALDRYNAVYGAHTAQALNESTARAATEEFLIRWAPQLTEPGRPHGCFAVQTALTCSEQNRTVRDELTRRRGIGEQVLRERYERAAAEDDLPVGRTPESLARFVYTVGLGLAVRPAAVPPGPS